jgi:hypothetical protein
MSGTDPLIRIRDLRYRYPGAAHDVLRIPFLDVNGTGLIAITPTPGQGRLRRRALDDHPPFSRVARWEKVVA